MKPLPNQSIIDIALQTAGTVEAVFELMKENNYEIDFQNSIPAKTNIKIPAAYKTTENQILKYFQTQKIEIATDFHQPAPELEWILQQGIWNDTGVWKDSELWNDFIDNWLLDDGFWNDEAFFIDTYNWNDN